ncbi:MAG: HAD family hydrolase [Stappiaceae bacterium]
MACNAFDLVIFDCDGVLIDSEMISAGLLAREMANLVPSIDLDYVLTHYLGRAFPRVAVKFETAFGQALDDDFERRYRDKLAVEFEGKLTEMPGVRHVLANLAVPHCVATSSSPARVKMSLEMIDLLDECEDVLYTSSQVRRGKPAPDLFLHVAKEMQVEPSACLVIEDSMPGIRAALAAGMTVWHFTGGSHLQRSCAQLTKGVVPHHTFSTFDDFFKLEPGLKQIKRNRG